ncbi:hypothetical protein ABZ353_10765 [Streptomyces niveus]|uniref:hypothetical protein n=1 Tax=Streptomyces niveus TaxID=193462 RepID=UPI0033F68CE7
MPIISGLTDALLVKKFHLGQSDREIAEEFGITVQAVSARRMRLGLDRRPIVKRVNTNLAARWQIKATQGANSHHNSHPIKMLKIYLRDRLGDDDVHQVQRDEVALWIAGLQERDEVLCYDPESKSGWFYRPRTPQDGQRIIDWPADLPFEDQGFKRALDLPS